MARRYAADLRGVFAALRAGAQLDDPKALVRRIGDGYLAPIQPGAVNAKSPPLEPIVCQSRDW